MRSNRINIFAPSSVLHLNIKTLNIIETRDRDDSKEEENAPQNTIKIPDNLKSQKKIL